MAAAASSGTNQRLSLDHPAFEKLLAAAWVLQCLHDQLHPQVHSNQEIAEPAETRKRIETARSSLPEVVRPLVEFSPTPVEAESHPVPRDVGSADDEILAVLVETQQAIETGALDLSAAMQRVVALSLKFAKAEGAAIWLLAREEFTYRAGAGTASDTEKLRLAVLSSLAGSWPRNGEAVRGDAKQSWVSNLGGNTTSLLVAPIYHGRELAGALAALTTCPDSFSSHTTTTVRLLSGLLSHALRKAAEVEVVTTNVKAVESAAVELKSNVPPERASQVQLTKPVPYVRKKPPEAPAPVLQRSSFNLRTTLDRLVDACSHHARTFHVNFTQRTLRAVAIATPIWLLAVVAAFLLLETLIHDPFHSGQAISAVSPSTAEAAVAMNPPAPSTSTPPAPARTTADATRVESARPRRSTPIPPLAVSHQEITDPATSSVVQQLSRYEISGLRRQAKYGDDSAAFTLGMAYEVGRYVHQNCVEAARWVRTAAEAGNAAAQYNLGLRYRSGDGVLADLRESERWLRKAAAHRNREAKLALQLLASR